MSWWPSQVGHWAFKGLKILNPNLNSEKPEDQGFKSPSAHQD